MTAKKTRTPTPPPPGKLSNIGELRSEMARVYRASRKGQIATKDMTRFVYALRTMGQMIEVEQFEARLQRLEGSALGKS